MRKLTECNVDRHAWGSCQGIHSSQVDLCHSSRVLKVYELDIVSVELAVLNARVLVLMPGSSVSMQASARRENILYVPKVLVWLREPHGGISVGL